MFRQKRATEKSVTDTEGQAVKGVEDIRAGLQELGKNTQLPWAVRLKTNLISRTKIYVEAQESRPWYSTQEWARMAMEAKDRQDPYKVPAMNNEIEEL